MAYHYWRTLGSLVPHACRYPRGTDRPDNVATERDEERADEVHGEEDTEAFPHVAVVGFRIAFSPVVA